MSDDFLGEISSAVDSASVSAPAPTAPAPVTNDVTKTNTPTLDKTPAAEDIYNDLEKSFGIDEPVKKAEKPAPEQKEVKEKTTLENKAALKSNPNQKTARFLDTFLKEDAQGNFVTANGEIIATAGKSREHLEGLKREGRAYRDAANQTALSNVQLAGKFKELYTEYAKLKESKNNFNWQETTGFSPKEAEEAVSLMKAYKADPIEAIKQLLTSAKLNGIDISKIGANVSADPAMIKKVVQELLTEQVTPLKESAQQDRAIKEAQQEVQRFYATYPDAEKYEDSIVAAKQQFPQMSIEEIWLRLERAMMQRQKTSSATGQRLTPKTYFKLNRQGKPVTNVVTKLPTNPDFSKMSFREIAELTAKELDNG